MTAQSRSWFARWFGAYPEPPAGKEAREGFHWKKFGRHYLHALPWIVALILLMHVVEMSGVLKGFESAALDTFLRLQTQKMSDRVAIVEITDEDYLSPELFNGQSPLNHERLIDLVSAIQRYHPAAIAMDFDTQSGDWCHMDSARLAKVLPSTADSHASTNNTPVVWAEIPSNLQEPLKLTPVLGGKLQNTDYVGVPRFPIDSDGVVRHYEEKFKVRGSLVDCAGKTESRPDMSKEDGRAMLPSFANAILAKACKNGLPKCSATPEKIEEPVIFNFFGDRYHFPIIQSHEFIGPEAEVHLRSGDLDQARREQLSNRVVLIGGNFSAARDVYVTPLGTMAGVELIGLAMESDFGGGIREASKWLEKLADFIVGSLIVLIYFYYRRRPRFALWSCLLGLPLVAIVFSLILFRTAAYWFNFMPIIIGMVMHQMLELSESNAELRERLYEFERKAREESLSALCVETHEPGGNGEKSVDGGEARGVAVRETLSLKQQIEPPLGEPPGSKR